MTYEEEIYIEIGFSGTFKLIFPCGCDADTGTTHYSFLKEKNQDNSTLLESIK